MRAALISLAAAAIFLTGCHKISRGGTVSGQVFVATAGGMSYKLGDVEVMLYAHDPTAERLQARRGEVQKMADERTDMLRYVPRDGDTRHIDTYLRSALIYCEELGPPLKSVRTDGDGRYAVEFTTNGRYLIVCRARRELIGGEEIYSWVINVDGSKGDVTLNLTNSNMTSSGDKSLAIQSVRPGDESMAAVGEQQFARLRRTFEAEKIRRRIADETNARQAAEAQRAADERREAYIRDHFVELVKASQARALRAHPDLATPDSDFNQRFLAAYNDAQTKNDSVLQDPNWPERLAGDAPPPIDVPAMIPPPAKATPPQAVPSESATVSTWRTPHPPYPAQARIAHIQGTTTVRVTTDASGNVSSCVIVKSAGSSILDESTLSYVRNNWKGPPNSTHQTEFSYVLH